MQGVSSTPTISQPMSWVAPIAKSILEENLEGVRLASQIMADLRYSATSEHHSAHARLTWLRLTASAPLASSAFKNVGVPSCVA
jgi:hypothetical protein